MKSDELAAATAEFDREMVVSKSRPLTAAERRTWEAARRKPGRPRRGAGASPPGELPVSMVVEERLLIATATSPEDWTTRICYLPV